MGNKTKPRIEAARLAEIMSKADYISKSQLYWQNFVRGLFFGFGSLLGATLVIAIVMWLLSLFSVVPFLGPIAENARQTIQQDTQ
jgi:4-hydroxybenzoate polyprenyltransferase